MTDHLAAAIQLLATASQDDSYVAEGLAIDRAQAYALISIAKSLQIIAGRPEPAPESPSTPDPAPTDPPKAGGPQIDAEPPEGSVVLDVDGDAWQRYGSSWTLVYGARRWDELREQHSPLTVLYRPDDTPEARAHRACKDARWWL